jgi:hypothetical protein
MYSIYEEYLNNIQNYSIQSSGQALSIRYFKTNIPLTKGVDADLDMIVAQKYKKTYDIFDFAPVLSATPLNYTNNDDESNQGIIRNTFGSLTLMCVEEPLPGDLFHYYGNDSHVEIFSVDEVNFVFSTKHLNIYSIEFKTANISKKSIDELTINNHYYFLKEFRKFFLSSIYDDYSFIMTERDEILEEINNKYNSGKCWYTLSEDDDINYKTNQILLYLNELMQLEVDIILFKDGFEFNDDNKHILLKYSDNLVNSIEYTDSLLSRIYHVYEVYFKLENYETPVDTISPAIKDTHVKEDASITVKDLDGNILAKEL